MNGERLFFSGRVEPSAEYPSPNALFMHNLQTGETELLATSVHGENGTICCMDVSENWLSWMTYLAPFGGEWRVFAKNLATGRETIIDREEDANFPAPPSVALSGDNLVWSPLRKIDDDTVKSYVMLYNLADGRTETIVETTWPESLEYVDIDGDRVVWSKKSAAGGGQRADVFLYDLTARELTQVTDDGYSEQPQIEGDYLVWRQGFGDIGPIIIHNLETGERVQLSEWGGWVLLGDGLVVWHRWVGEVATFLYDIERNVMDGVVPFGSEYRTGVTLSGRSVVLCTRPDDNDWVYGAGRIEVRTYPPLSGTR